MFGLLQFWTNSDLLHHKYNRIIYAFLLQFICNSSVKLSKPCTGVAFLWGWRTQNWWWSWRSEGIPAPKNNEIYHCKSTSLFKPVIFMSSSGSEQHHMSTSEGKAMTCIQLWQFHWWQLFFNFLTVCLTTIYFYHYCCDS